MNKDSNKPRVLTEVLEDIIIGTGWIIKRTLYKLRITRPSQHPDRIDGLFLGIMFWFFMFGVVVEIVSWITE